MEALREIPQIFRNPLTQQTVVDGRKLYVAPQQSLRHPPLLPQQFCCCSIPTACCLNDFSQLSVYCGQSILKGMQLVAASLCCWLPSACFFCEVVWWAARDFSNQPFNIPDSEIFLGLISHGVDRIPLQTCAVLLPFLCKLYVTLCC